MIKRLFRRFTVILLAAVLTAGLIVPAYAEEDYVEAGAEAVEVGTELSSSGICGSYANYTWNASTGELVISGKGNVDPYYGQNNIFSRKDEIKSVVIKEGIKVIGPQTFLRSKNIKRIEIPSTCVLIEHHAFNGIHDADVYYNGTKEQFWNDVMIEYTNQGIMEGRLHFKKGQQHQFEDVTDRSAYYYNAVSWAGVKGIASGIGNSGNFAPKQSCTRAMIVTLLYRIAGSPKTNASCPFNDVKKGDWYYDAVCWAAKEGITSGYGTGKFSPNDLCNRAMIVTFILNFDGGVYDEVYSVGNEFMDVKSTDWFYHSVYWGRNQIRFIKGKGDGNFHPYDPCTRGEVMTFLYRYMNDSTRTGRLDQIAE